MIQNKQDLLEDLFIIKLFKINHGIDQVSINPLISYVLIINILQKSNNFVSMTSQ